MWDLLINHLPSCAFVLLYLYLYLFLSCTYLLIKYISVDLLIIRLMSYVFYYLYSIVFSVRIKRCWIIGRKQKKALYERCKDYKSITKIHSVSKEFHSILYFLYLTFILNIYAYNLYILGINFNLQCNINENKDKRQMTNIKIILKYVNCLSYSIKVTWRYSSCIIIFKTLCYLKWYIKVTARYHCDSG